MIYLLLLSLIGTLTTQSGMDIFVTLTVLTLLVQAIRKKGPEGWKLFSKMNLEAFWVFWVAVIALGFVLNGHFDGPLWKRLGEMRWILILYLMVSAYQYVRLDLEKLIKVVLAVSVIVCIGSLIVSVVKGEDRVGGILNSPMTMAHSYSLLFLTLSGIFLYRWKLLWEQERGAFYIWIASLAVVGATLVLTLTRGVWIALFFGVLAIAVALSWRLALLIISGTSLLIAGLFIMWPRFQERFLFAFNYQNNYDSERVVLWKTNWMIFKDHPLFGAGYGENYTLLGKYYALQGLPENQFTGHAHNQFLHMLAGTGVVGLICYLFIYFYFIWQAWSIFNSKESSPIEKAWAIGIFGALVGFAFGGLTESNFEHAKVRMMLIFIWALLIYIKAKPTGGGRYAG
ncbi:O-antigen ligase family protein [Bdellovibrio bacteriovorus]|uniref:O-antigen ligase family protein n=1 Tax=Bdellovibrio bacteriovorus TaxID=959 RepID=UPI0035A5A19D